MVSYDYREEVADLYQDFDCRTLDWKYVGATDEEDDGEPFDEKIKRFISLLNEQQEEGIKLDQQISENLKSIGYELK